MQAFSQEDQEGSKFLGSLKCSWGEQNSGSDFLGSAKPPNSSWRLACFWSYFTLTVTLPFPPRQSHRPQVLRTFVLLLELLILCYSDSFANLSLHLLTSPYDFFFSFMKIFNVMNQKVDPFLDPWLYFTWSLGFALFFQWWFLFLLFEWLTQDSA